MLLSEHCETCSLQTNDLEEQQLRVRFCMIQACGVYPTTENFPCSIFPTKVASPLQARLIIECARQAYRSVSAAGPVRHGAAGCALAGDVLAGRTRTLHTAQRRSDSPIARGALENP